YSAKTVASLDGKAIRLGGYPVPLENDAKGRVTEFFLVPYPGACIHVPPPPPNQIVLVRYPHTTERRFRIALTDLGEVGFLSLILERLTRDAPFAEVEVLPLQVDEVGAWLSSAKVDAAICRQPVPGARSQRVLHERYVCLLSDRHPRIGDSLSLEQYLAERHIVVTRTSGHGIAEDVLEAMQVQRRISLRVPHFSVLPKIIPGTELLTILPAQIAYRFVAEGGMRMLELPFTLPPFDVSLHWHESSERSAALNWFRTTIAEAIIAAQR
ncbi:DUF3299 domain-containing protein, partial [Pseudomonas aeruginosa]|uniref:DUF3299 domain-containing protein n=1 Tax=Pseudomonas aeruginosa TaxID=287 RepID=UPI001911B916